MYTLSWSNYDTKIKYYSLNTYLRLSVYYNVYISNLITVLT